MTRDWLTLAFGVALVGVVVGLSLHQHSTRDAGTPTGTTAAAPPAAESGIASPASGAAAAPATAPPPERAPAAVRAAATPALAPARVEATAVLQVTSDVPGASVFLDREFVGTTPLTLPALVPGARRINVTATGHEGYTGTVNLTEGSTRVNVEFLKVRLDARVPVVHRHAMGSCQGMLTATSKGLVYETANDKDAFTMALGDVDVFDVDYLKKNLRIRRREGKTWNFTNASADALFVFHRDVSQARDKLVATR